MVIVLFQDDYFVEDLFLGDHSGLDTSGLNGHSGFSTAKNLEDESWSLYIKMPSVIKVISKYTDWNLRWLLKMMVTLAQRYIYIPVSPVSPLFCCLNPPKQGHFFSNQNSRGPIWDDQVPRLKQLGSYGSAQVRLHVRSTLPAPQRMGTFHHQLRTPETN